MTRHYLRARFTRWVCRKDIDPDGKLPLWLLIAMHWLFSPGLYLWLCQHQIWLERPEKTDIVIVIAEYMLKEEPPCEPSLKERLKWHDVG